MLQYTQNEPVKIYRAQTYAGVALCIYVIALMILVNGDQWPYEGIIYLTFGVLGYLSILFGSVIFYRKPVMIARDGRKYNFTIWHMLGFGLFGGLMSRIVNLVETQGEIWSIAPWIVVAAILLMLATRFRAAK